MIPLNDTAMKIKRTIPLIPGRRILLASLCLGLLLMPGLALSKQFIDNLTTDFYGGKEDNIQIGQNLDGNLTLAPYRMLGSWTTTSGPSNASLYLADATVYNGKIYLSGGFGSAESTSFGGPETANAINKVWYGTMLTDGSIDEWKEVDDKSRLPQPTYGHSSVVVNGRLYIIGGRSTGEVPLSAVYWAKILGHDGTIKAYYKSNTWTAVASLPEPRFRARSVYFEGRIYVLGGQDENNVATNTVYYADVQPGGDIFTWTTASVPLPTPLSGHCADVSSGQSDGYGRIYILGGSTTGQPNGISSGVYLGTIDTNSGALLNWVQTTPLPDVRYAAAATIDSGKIWVCGGIASATAKSEVFFARIDRTTGLIPGSGQRGSWSRATDLPIEVSDHNFVSFNGHLYLLGGQNATGIQNLVYTSTLSAPKVNINFWVPTTPLFLSPYGAGEFSIWTGHTTILRVPLPGESRGISSGAPTVFVIGGGPNTFSAYAGGMGDASNLPPAAFSTIYNSEVNPNGTLQTWAAPDTGGSLPIATIHHASTLANGAIYVIGGANSINAWIWTGAASRSLTAVGQSDPQGRPYQTGNTVVLYEEVGQGSSSGGAGSFEFTEKIPIYDPLYEASVAAGTPSNPATISGFQANTATPIYQPLMRHATVSHSGIIYTIGGVSRENIGWAAGNPAGGSQPVYEDRVWYCRPNPGGTINEGAIAGGWQTTEPLIATGQAPSLGPRYDLAACVAYNRVYIFGGRNAASVPVADIFYADINIEDRSLGAWRELITAPISDRGVVLPLAEHQVIFMNGRFYVIGGINPAGILSDRVLYCTLDPATGQIPVWAWPGSWESSSTLLAAPVTGHAAVANNGFIYLLGGRYNNVPHTSSAYMTSIIDLYQFQDIVYAWAGTFERYIDLNRDQLIETVNWEGRTGVTSVGNGILRVKCRYAMAEGQWTPWTVEQELGPFDVQQFARYIHYKVRLETLANDRNSNADTPIITRIFADYAESKQVDNDNFQVNHNKFDPQTGTLLITYKTRNRSVSNVLFRVYNLEGELIRRQSIDIPPLTPLPATGSWIWDGTNENAEMVANGVYVIQYNSGNTHKIRKVVVYKR